MEITNCYCCPQDRKATSVAGVVPFDCTRQQCRKNHGENNTCANWVVSMEQDDLYPDMISKCRRGRCFVGIIIDLTTSIEQERAGRLFSAATFLDITSTFDSISHSCILSEHTNWGWRSNISLNTQLSYREGHIYFNRRCCTIYHQISQCAAQALLVLADMSFWIPSRTIFMWTMFASGRLEGEECNNEADFKEILTSLSSTSNGVI